MMAKFQGNQAALTNWLSSPEGMDYYDSLPNTSVRLPRVQTQAFTPRVNSFQPRINRGTINFSSVKPGFQTFMARLPYDLKMVGNGMAVFGGWLWKVIKATGGYIIKAIKFVGKMAQVAGEIGAVEGARFGKAVGRAGEYARKFATNPYTRARAQIRFKQDAVKSFKWIGDGIAKVTLAIGEGGGFAAGRLVKNSVITIGKLTWLVLSSAAVGVGKTIALTLKLITKINLGILKGLRGKTDLKLKPGQPVRNFFRKAKNKAVEASLKPTAVAMTATEMNYAVPALLQSFGVNVGDMIQTGKDKITEVLGDLSGEQEEE